MPALPILMFRKRCNGKLVSGPTVQARYSLRKRLLTGGAWAVSLRAVAMVIGLVVSMILARILSARELGEYFLIVSIVTLMSVVADLGLGKTALRFVAGVKNISPAHAVRMTSRLLLISLVISAFVWILFIGPFLGEKFGSGGLASHVVLLSLWFVALCLLRYFAEIFRGEHDIRLASLYTGVAERIIPIGAFSIVLITGRVADLSFVVSAVVAGLLAAATTAGFRLQRRYGFLGPATSLPAQKVWPVAWPIGIANTAILAVSVSDIWVIGAFATKEDLALYGVAMRIVLLVSIPFGLINGVLQPIIVELYAKKELGRLERALGASSALSAVPAVITLAVVLIVGEQILELVFGPGFGNAYQLLIILCAGRTVTVLAGPSGLCLMLGGYQREMMVTTLLFGAMSLIAAIYFVKPFGAIGVAGSFAVGLALSNLVQAAMVLHLMGVSPFADITSLRRSKK